MTLIAEANGAQVHLAPWQELGAVVGECDAVIVDAPYSIKTHAGHFAGTTASGSADPEWCKRRGYDDKVARRRPLSYGAWTPADVSAFVADWSPRCRGWMVSITDDVLAHDWQRAYQQAGRYAFAPLPFLELGKQPRLTGDGPASWTCWIMVSRPKSVAYSRWGSLDGGYATTDKDQDRIPGGKPIALMERLVLAYSRPGDLVVDPCCGAGTTLVAAIRHGRRATGGDIDPTHAGLAAQWIANPHRRAPGIERDNAGGSQPSLFTTETP